MGFVDKNDQVTSQHEKKRVALLGSQWENNDLSLVKNEKNDDIIIAKNVHQILSLTV